MLIIVEIAPHERHDATARMKGGPAGKKRLVAALNRATLSDTGAACVPVDSGSDQPAKPVHLSCAHVPMKAALDSSVWCIRCGVYLGEAN